MNDAADDMVPREVYLAAVRYWRQRRMTVATSTALVSGGFLLGWLLHGLVGA